MPSPDLAWLAWAFTAISAIRALAYVPQLIAVARSRDGARDIALSTWIIWILNNALGAAYTALVSREWVLSASFAASALACLAIVAMTMVKRHQQGLAERAAQPLPPSSSSTPRLPRFSLGLPMPTARPPVPPLAWRRPLAAAATVAAVAALWLATSPVHAEGLSVGAGAGAVNGRTDCVSGYRCNRRDGGLRLFAGWQVDDAIEVQALYLHAGRFHGGNTTPGGTEFGGRFDVQALGVTGGYRWPLDGGWVLEAQAGVAAVRTRFRYASPYDGTVSKTVAQPLVGLGVAYPIAPGWELSLDYDATRFKVHTEVGLLQMLGLSARYSF